MGDLSPALKTDLYELTMAAGYFKYTKDLTATFELFCHKGSPLRPYYIACGLEQAVEYLLDLNFSSRDIDHIRKLPIMRHVDKKFFDYLRSFEFTGDVWAMPEGEVFFPLEPILQITAPIIEAQIVETYLLSIMHIQTLVATKASRVVASASSDGRARKVIEFGSRRAHGPEAAVLAARAAYIGGCAGTSNVFAGVKFGIPVYGTMAHSWIEAFDGEGEAFNNYKNIFGKEAVFLVDTYDTIKGVELAASSGRSFAGIRLDSGDIASLSRRARAILDEHGHGRARIMASGNLNEYKIRELVKRRSPIDAFGVGTDMVTSRDMPFIDLIYKLVQTGANDEDVKLKAKCSSGKATLPGRKQVYRKFTRGGFIENDIISMFSQDSPESAQRLLEQVVRNGRLVRKMPSIEDSRGYAAKRLKLLPPYALRFSARRRVRVDTCDILKCLNRQVCG